MATVLDVSLLQDFQIIFGWLFIFILVYAALEITKALGENKGLHAVLAVCFATLFSFSSKAMTVVTGAAPWFVVLLVIIMFLLIGVRFAFGVEGGDAALNRVFGTTAGWWIFIPVIIIIGVLIMTTLGPGLLPLSEDGSEPVEPGEKSTSTKDFSTNVWNTLFHPKMLGTGAILMIAVFAIALLCSTPLKW